VVDILVVTESARRGHNPDMSLLAVVESLIVVQLSLLVVAECLIIVLLSLVVVVKSLAVVLYQTRGIWRFHEKAPHTLSHHSLRPHTQDKCPACSIPGFPRSA
jgi:hypothetical protein